MEFNNNFLKRYLLRTPSALGYERAIECELHADKAWPSPILDIGCGDGIFAEVLFAGTVDTGIDPDAGEIEKAKAGGKYRELLVCGGHQIPKPDSSFNTVFSNSVLEHIPDLLPVLREINRLMSEDARFYVTIPTDRLERATFLARILSAIGLEQAAESYGRFYNRFWRHFNVHSLQEWRAIFEEAGFEVEIERPYVPVNQSTLYDLLTPVALPALVAKKMFNRWFLIPPMRPLIAPVLGFFLAGSVKKALALNTNNGCLVYYSLKKSLPS